MVFSYSCSWFLFRFVSCYWWLTHFLIYWLFWFFFFLKHVQFLEEELSLSHLHMLSHFCFCPGGLPCWFFPPDIIIWFAAASVPCFGFCGSAEFACGCSPGGWWRHCCPTLHLGVIIAFPSAPLSCSSAGLRVIHGSLRSMVHQWHWKNQVAKGVWCQHPVQLFRFAS